MPSQHNPAMQDIAQALGNSVDRDGSGGMRAPLDMGGNPVRNAGNGSVSSDLATVGQAASAGLPVGAIVDFAGSVAPANYLLCYGQAVSRSEYAELFAAIGVTYGIGNGSTTFNLPDCRGRVSAGKDDMGGASADRLTSPVNGDALGGVGGAQSISLTADQMPIHTHSGTTAENGAHTHAIKRVSNVAGGGSQDVAHLTGTLTMNTESAGSHTHGFTTGSAGGDQAHPNVQPTIIFNKIIKTRAA